MSVARQVIVRHLKILLVRLLLKVPDSFIADKLDGLPQSIFQVLGNGVGVLVGVFIQGVQEAEALSRTHAVPVQQRGHGLEGGMLPAAKDFGEIEAQQALLIPFAAVQEHYLGIAQQHHPAGRFRAPEHLPGYENLQGIFQCFLGLR